MRAHVKWAGLHQLLAPRLMKGSPWTQPPDRGHDEMRARMEGAGLHQLMAL